MSTMIKPCKCTTETKEELYYKINEIIDDYRGKDGSLIPILHIAQGIYGYLTPELLQFIAEKLNMPFSKVYGVATFYSYFTITPQSLPGGNIPSGYVLVLPAICRAGKKSSPS